MSTSDVAAVFGVDPKTVTRWANTGKLPCPLRTLGGHRRFFRTDIQALIAEQNKQATDHNHAEAS
jgi:excisionase family DNA binding protein